jgi:hypothetical protein
MEEIKIFDLNQVRKPGMVFYLENNQDQLYRGCFSSFFSREQLAGGS